ncbi:MAG: hypothetical protein SFY67_19555 [Candidatus Melainabacteria bacterium]|nr:hypothetical protein [Candidatus Melainabacteria bacterium]
MKSKILTVILAIGSGFLLTVIQSIAVLAANKAQCLITLSIAKRFEDKQIGEGEASKTYKAYEEAFNNSDSIKKEDYLWLLQNGTPAGKVYAAMLLRGSGKANDADSFGKLSNDQSKIEVQSGCEVFKDTVSEIVKSFIKSGDYLGIKYLNKNKK